MARIKYDPNALDFSELTQSQPYASRIKHSGFELNNDNYDPKDTGNPGRAIHTTQDMVAALRGDPNMEIDARVLAVSKNEMGFMRLDKKGFLESWDKSTSKFKESFDAFAMDSETTNLGYGIVGGQDFVPLLGGPFYKQLYYYDYIRMHNQAFFAYNHDPFARNIVQCIRDFTLGRGWRVDSDNKAALALWEAFVEVNEIEQLMESFAIELSLYGENLLWWLPNNETKIGYRLNKGQDIPKGFIPRVRLLDPSNIWEIVTYPEDISRVLYYQWVAPTQYQIYSGRDNKGQSVPSTKFIFQQLPAEDVMHFKVNSVSNEKRGRSDLFPVLGYLKRLRDTVNYSIIGLQKNAAWSLDTTIEGAQSDIDAYVADQQSLGTIPTAGSEFVHTSKITRQYLANQGLGKGGGSSAFEWCMNMIAVGSGIPVQYFGTHIGNSTTRASAMVATEPVAKKFEMRQSVYERVLKKMAKKLFTQFGIDAEIEVTFPEIVTQDRSAKLKDIAMCEQQGWITSERAGSMAAKEMGVTEYNYDEEQGEIQKTSTALQSPLTSAPKEPQNENPSGLNGGSSAVTKDDRRQLSMGRGM